MIEAIVYDRIEMKDRVQTSLPEKLTSEEALIHCLDFMDFLAVFHSGTSKSVGEEITWVVLEIDVNDK